MSLTISQVVGQALIQDLGRSGYASLGVSPSGAANRQAMIAVNQAVGNLPGACGIEFVGALRVRVRAASLFALAGAPTQVRGGRLRASHYQGLEVWSVAAGEEIEITSLGWRSYLGVRGGLQVPLILGSGAYDTLSGLGTPPLQVGDELAVGRMIGELRTIDPGLRQVPPPGAPGPLLVASVYPGPRQDWVADLATLFENEYQVSPQSNRVGSRLVGPELTRAVRGELPSEGLVRGAIQIPPSGEPMIFGPDHPTTGGYPVIGVLAPGSVDALAHAQPGQAVRFRRATLRPR